MNAHMEASFIVQLGDDSRVDDLAIRDVNGEKFVFVSTVTKVHRFPLERCSRLQGCRQVKR